MASTSLFIPEINLAQFSTSLFCRLVCRSSVCACTIAAPARTHSTPSRTISSAVTGMRGCARRVHAPLSATSIQVFFAIRIPRMNCASGSLQEEAQVLRQQHALVDDDLAARDLEAAAHSAKDVFAPAADQVGLGLETVAMHDE